jgi:acetyl esterase/lipase
VVVHGGSWRTGDKGDLPAFSKGMADRGYVVFDVAYRLAPEARFPAGIADVKCAIGYVKANASRYGIDPDRLVLLGRFAGAQIALVAAYSANDPELPASCPAGDTSVRAVISYYAPTRIGLLHRDHPRAFPRRPRRLSRRPAETFPDQYRQARPASWIGPATPPTLLLSRLPRPVCAPARLHELADGWRMPPGLTPPSRSPGPTMASTTT